MNLHPGAGDVLATHREEVDRVVARFARAWLASEVTAAQFKSEIQPRILEMVDMAFGQPPSKKIPQAPNNDSSNGSLGIGIGTSVFLVFASFALGPLALLGIPAVIFWLAMARVVRQTPENVATHAERQHQSDIRHWERLKRETASSLAIEINGLFYQSLAMETGVPKRLWQEFTQAMSTHENLSFWWLREEVAEWAALPEFPEAPAPVEDGISHEAYESYCRDVLHSWGYLDAVTSRFSRDGGVDIESTELVVQCKHVAGSVGAPEVQRIFGIGSSRGKKSLIFSAGTFTKEAIKFANQAGVGIVVLSERNGILSAKNPAALEIIEANTEGPK